MSDYKFWKRWNKISKLEEAAIKSLKSAKKLIFENIPKDEIVSIYAKGSFVRREMTKDSDFDATVILKTSKWLNKLRRLVKKYGSNFKPEIQITGYSLWELKNNKKTRRKTADNRPGPSRVVQHLEHYKLIYGKDLRKEDFNQGDDKKRLKTMINLFKEVFLPNYEKKVLSFSDLAKQVFWLTENEQKVLGKNPPYHFEKLAKSIVNKNHIIYDALRIRLRPTENKKERECFIRKLKKYLSELDKLTTT